jgi:polysaccharide pyruvyl transferase WcaK-like protein
MAKYAVFGHVGNGNLGDEAIIAAVIHNLRRRDPSAEIVGLSGNASDTEQRHAIPSFPIRRGSRSRPVDVPATPASVAAPDHPRPSPLADALRRVPLLYRAARAGQSFLRRVMAVFAETAFFVRSARRLRGTSVLIVAGSGQLFDGAGGAWGFPWTILKWCILARLRGARVAFASVGAGPIRSRLSSFFLVRALSLASYRSFRDENSRELMGSLGFRREGGVVPDLAHSLPLDPDPRPPAARRVVGLNPVPYYDPRYWYDRDPARYGRFVDTLAAFAAELLRRGYALTLFPTQVRADPRVVEDVRTRLVEAGADLSRVSVPTVRNLEDLLGCISGTDIVVASRFHGVMLPYLLGKPVLALAYQAKTSDLMAAMGLRDHALPIEGLTVEALLERLDAVERRAPDARRMAREAVASHRRLLDEQYDRLVGLARRRGS